MEPWADVSRQFDARKQKTPGSAGRSMTTQIPRLTLGELEPFARTRLTGLLTLLHARIAGQKTFFF